MPLPVNAYVFFCFDAQHAQAESVEAMQPLKFSRIGEDPTAAPVVTAGGRAARRKTVAYNKKQKYVVFCF